MMLLVCRRKKWTRINVNIYMRYGQGIDEIHLGYLTVAFLIKINNTFSDFG